MMQIAGALPRAEMFRQGWKPVSSIMLMLAGCSSVYTDLSSREEKQRGNLMERSWAQFAARDGAGGWTTAANDVPFVRSYPEYCAMMDGHVACATTLPYGSADSHKVVGHRLVGLAELPDGDRCELTSNSGQSWGVLHRASGMEWRISEVPKSNDHLQGAGLSMPAEVMAVCKRALQGVSAEKRSS